MVKKLLKYIFIYTLLVGCDSNSVLGTCDSNCYLDVSAPSLEIDDNNYYHMVFLDSYIQTFTISSEPVLASNVLNVCV